MAQFKQLELRLDTVDLILNPLQGKRIEPQSSTQELVVTNKKPISNDKQTTSKVCTQKPKSSKKLAQDSTTNAKVLKPFWNESCQEMWNCLWLGIKTASLDSDLTSLTGFVNSTIANSWFATTVSYLQKEKWWKTYLQSFTSSHVVSTDYQSPSG